MRARARVVGSLGAAVLLIGTGMLPAEAGGRHPGPDHAGGTTLVWSRLTADRDAAQVVRSDDGGRTVRAVTAAVPGVYDMDPQLSPDGRTVLFERDLPGRPRDRRRDHPVGPSRLVPVRPPARGRPLPAPLRSVPAPG
ncbi:TolB-like translocation protein [Cellulomonas palmilytica]|uniref:hypothetical protein n=1 Tax=Cellulomonas palmilytica TaxID=2608402 RepID=UPI001F29B95B|nr:hypothetical protein [Cellulomonas palmilytica]UJP40014.1 hypothetical protein F1D97_00140 [Cellulomonas palmilytica]